MSESNSINRRDFVKSAGVAAASVLLANALPIGAQTNKKRYDRLSFTGTKADSKCAITNVSRFEVAEKSEAFLMKNFTGKREKLAMPQIEGEHAGGDDRLRDVIFKNASVPDYLKLPSARAGAMSCLVGIAARTSIEKLRPVKISELIRL